MKELEEKLENLKKENKDLKHNNESLKTEQEDLREQIQALSRENEELRSMGSSPSSSGDAGLWPSDASDAYSPSTRAGHGSSSSYDSSRRF
jgi:chromosome segregation ATPase